MEKERFDIDMPENLTKDKIWGFKAILSSNGKYRFDIDTKGCSIEQLGVLKILHERIGDTMKDNVKEFENNEQTFKIDEE